MVPLGGLQFLMSEVPLCRQHPSSVSGLGSRQSRWLGMAAIVGEVSPPCRTPPSLSARRRHSPHTRAVRRHPAPSPPRAPSLPDQCVPSMSTVHPAFQGHLPRRGRAGSVLIPSGRREPKRAGSAEHSRVNYLTLRAEARKSLS